MGGTLRPYGPGGRANPDWALIAVGLMAVALLAGTMIRTGTPAAQALFGTQVGGLRTLSETETLVLFEDHALPRADAAGWSGGARNAEHSRLGAVWLADPPDAPLSREIALPAGTTRAVLSLDLIAIDDWALEGLSLAIGGVEVLQHRFTTRPGLERVMPALAGSEGGVVVRASADAPREQGFAAGDPALGEARLRLDIAIAAPGDSVILTITPLPAEQPDPLAAAPRWAVDNLMLVADSGI